MISLPLDGLTPRPSEGGTAAALAAEWLVTSGLGGYASGTVAWCNTRKYHGLFVPSLKGFGRTVMLSVLDDTLTVDGRRYPLRGAEHSDARVQTPSLPLLRAFTLRGLIPEWDYQLGAAMVRKSVVLVHAESTVFAIYTHLEGPRVHVRLRPFPTFRPHDARPTLEPHPMRVELDHGGVQVTFVEGAPPLKLGVVGTGCATPFTALAERTPPLYYRVDAARGNPHLEVLDSPGYFECTLEPGGQLAFGATLNGWDSLDRSPADVLKWEEERELKLLERCGPKAQSGVAARLALAADQFIIAPKHRPPDTAWARAVGQDVRSVIAGYPWFTDWGRDTMISLEGLALCTGRAREAAAILRTFQHHVKDGLVPNYFPEGEQQGLYHTADATLWFFHAVERYLRHTHDAALLHDLWPTLAEIVQRHLDGTRFGIGVDPADGLLRQGQGGYQLTWMDAKVEDWVVTPRRGKAVEINALWFNALKLMELWAAGREGGDPAFYAYHAARAHAAFNARFWNDREECLFDVVDGERGDDASIRPNQVFAISLTHPVLVPERWERVLTAVQNELLTPVGLRTLSPRHPDFKATYDGDLRARDAAYHQGTVWPWLLGHYVDATLKVPGADHGEAAAVLDGLVEHLRHAGIGSISEIFDAVPPFHPRGCIAQAWSVAETLRVWLTVTSPYPRRDQTLPLP